MKERLASYIDVDMSNLTISTFHSLCAMILRREITFLGYNHDFVILDEEEQINEPQPIKPTYDKQAARRERRRRNRHAKQDAKRILDALTNLINGNNNQDDSSDDDKPRAPPLVEQPQLQPPQISFRRRRLAF